MLLSCLPDDQVEANTTRRTMNAETTQPAAKSMAVSIS